jgi:nitroreductase
MNAGITYVVPQESSRSSSDSQRQPSHVFEGGPNAISGARPIPQINELISTRSSPYIFSDRPVSDLDLLALFEAARWSASAGNEQPWSYIVARRAQSEQFDRMLSFVADVNLPWARLASALVIGCVRLTLEHTGGPYVTAEHDLGLASANLVFEATSRGLGVHQMTRIDRDSIREFYRIPEDVGVISGLAIGYAEDNTRIANGQRDTNLPRRSRKPLESFVFSGAWSEASPLVKIKSPAIFKACVGPTEAAY